MTRRPRPLTTLDREDRVVLFPSLGHLTRDGRHWLIDVHGDISSIGPVSLGNRVMLRWLKRAMRATGDEMASLLFRERIARFVAHHRAGRHVAVRVGDRVYRLPHKSRRNGHFQATIAVPAEEAEDFVAQGNTGQDRTENCLSLDVCGAEACGEVYLLPRTGASVISDIDDTLKHSHVACKRTLLTNTFLRPFETVPGMSSLFRQWSADGAAIHYVSSSPWQLYEHLADHLQQEGFPLGSFHLRAFRLRDHLLRRFLMMRRGGKLSVIRSILRKFPLRKFFLVGDSGERDPEIYGALARRYPDQVAGIFIRQLVQGDQARRYERALRGVLPNRVRLFRSPDELADIRPSVDL